MAKPTASSAKPITARTADTRIFFRPDRVGAAAVGRLLSGPWGGF
jgi:hypothetical protein